MSAKPSTPKPAPILVVSFFGKPAQARIIERLSAAQRPPGTELLVGTYGINSEVAVAVADAGGSLCTDVHA